MESQGQGQPVALPTFKIVIVGDQNVGKTCLLKRYIEGSFLENEDMTLGAQFYSKKLGVSYVPDND